MNGMLRCFVGIVVGGAAALVGARTAAASGFEIQENGRGLANAYAGAQATGDDASTAWWNPAGMTRLGGHHVAAAGQYLSLKGDFVDEGSFRAPMLPLTGESGETDEPAIVPNLFAVASLGSRWRVGLSVNAPFGLETDWGRTWIGRYHATNSRLETINIRPTVGWRACRWLSLGAGLDIQYAKVELGNAIDFGALLQMPQALDGHVEVEGDDWSLGWNVGVLIEPTCTTRIGLTYRSAIEHELEGDADFEVPAAAGGIVAATGRFRDTGARADIELPPQVALGVAQKIGRRWTILGSVVWTGWSTVDSVDIRFANPAEPTSSLVLDWDDVWRYSIGVTFEPTPCWAFRIGAAFDDSPVRDSTRGPRVPTNDRYWIAAGVGYRLNHRWSVDLGYAHLFVEDGDIAQTADVMARGALIGHVESDVNIVGLQINLRL